MAAAGAKPDDEEPTGERSYEEVLQSVGLGLKCMRETLQQQCQDAQHQLEKRLQEALYRQEQKLQNDFLQQLQEVQRLHDRRLQEALRQQALTLQHDFRKVLKDSVLLIQQKMQVTSHGTPEDSKSMRERQTLGLVAELLEEASLRADQSYASSPAGHWHQEDLEARMQKLEASMERALGDVFPRVDALLTRLDEPRHPLTPSSLSFISNFPSTSFKPGPLTTHSGSSTPNIFTSESSSTNSSNHRATFFSFPTTSAGSELTSQVITTAAPSAVSTSTCSVYTSTSNSATNTTSDNSAFGSSRVIPTSVPLNTTFGISASDSSISNSSTTNSNANISIPNSSTSTTSASSPVSNTASVPTTLIPASSTFPTSTSTCPLSSTSTSFVSITKSSYSTISTPSTSSSSNASTPYSSISTSCPESPPYHPRTSTTALQANDSSTTGVELMNEFGEAVLDGRVEDARRLLNEGVSSFMSWIKQ